MKRNITGADRKACDQQEYQPLYIRIARWGLSLGRPFTAKEMAEEFGLTPVKASGMMHYICGLGEERVSVRRTWRPGQTPMKKEVMDTLEILAVAERPAVKRRVRKYPPETTSFAMKVIWQTLARERKKGGMS
ncbi:hypothetical protein [Enterobacter asburiae]|uniref:hypothetical protein n=1 Tax=Enterobacter asburiae TaxID=61645 RepID=UPI001FFE87F2|nr:hypothetical protein [Enterobacter asburiae]MCK2177821.1 hypothetical protein [Enterobacter asburiae]